MHYNKRGNILTCVLSFIPTRGVQLRVGMFFGDLQSASSRYETECYEGIVQ